VPRRPFRRDTLWTLAALDVLDGVWVERTGSAAQFSQGARKLSMSRHPRGFESFARTLLPTTTTRVGIVSTPEPLDQVGPLLAVDAVELERAVVPAALQDLREESLDSAATP